VNLGTHLCFGTIARTVCDYLEVPNDLAGESVLAALRA
jgi:phosphopentomutase